jgi:hypothetical protein
MLNKQKFKTLAFFSLALFLCLCIINFYPLRSKKVVTTASVFPNLVVDRKQSSNLNQSLNLRISFTSDESTDKIISVDFIQGESLAKILRSALEDKKLNLVTKNFGGPMGEFVDSINGSKNTKDRWWQYWINGKYAKVGISNYFPKNGDNILFKLVEYKDSYEN